MTTPAAQRNLQSLVGIAASLAVAALVAWAGSARSSEVGGWPLFAVCAAVAFVVQWLAFVPAYLAQTEHYYDLTGSLTYLTLVAIALTWGPPTDLRALVLAVLVAVWALRLGSFLFRRVRQDGSDGRFDAIKPDPLRFLMSWTMQGLWVFLTLSCALAALTGTERALFGPLSALGVLVFAAGFAIEVVADRQKRAFRRDPANRGRFITTGLWAWSRHPNYFGEIVLWCGVALVAVPALGGGQLVTLVSPVFVYVLLTRISGVPLLESRAKRRWGDDPAYRAYKARTPSLWPRPPRRVAAPVLLLLALATALATTTPAHADDPVDGASGAGTTVMEKQLLFGDTHLHTSNSFDAYLNRNMTADPDTAYRFAKGLPVIHPYHRARVQIDTPLDFLVVADHAEYLGVMRTVVEEGIPREELGLADRVRAFYTEWWLRRVVERDEGMAAFRSFLPEPMSVEEAAANPRRAGIPGAAAISRAVWIEATARADAHDEPGRFTALIGWEWSSIPAGANLHRVVITSAGADVAARFDPFSSLDSAYPEDLWRWLDETSAATGAEFVAIPHNSNISKGYMFTDTTLRGEPYTAEIAAKRLEWEPVVEVTQIKGDSETHPTLSPDDLFAGFEIYPHYIQNDPPPYEPKPGDYVRSALRLGLSIERRLGVNPYRFGVIGSSDAHTGIASTEEPNFWGKLARDSIPENKRGFGVSNGGPTGWSMSASGLAAVWAEQNTRESILAALKRREVYATSGPRIRVRVAGGWSVGGAGGEPADAASVPMGALLPPRVDGAAPSFRVHAERDPKSAPLDRVQIVKGWIDAEGATHERVFDVAWSGERTPDADGRVPAVGDTVNPDTGRYDETIGSAELRASWSDPDFAPAASAFYYVRVLEIPTPRHSVFDAIALGVDPRESGYPVAIQERAYTSPIWYAP